MLNFIKNFRNDEDGAVTVDWVVLTAAIVGLGIAIMTTVGGATDDLGDVIATGIADNGIMEFGGADAGGDAGGE